MAHQTSYGTLPTLVGHDPHSLQDQDTSDLAKTRHQVGEFIESKRAHVLILLLTIIDILLVMAQIAVTLLGLDQSEKAEGIMELFAHASLAIVTVFLVEIILKTFAFGPSYFWKNTHNGLLHLADALIIVISFFLEVFLTGAEQELGSLLIVFRLWRIIKLTGTVTIKTAEQSHALVHDLEARIEELERQLEESEKEIRRLRAFNVDEA